MDGELGQGIAPEQRQQGAELLRLLYTQPGLDSYDRVCEKNADLWEKVDEAYFGLPDDYDFENYDEITFIRSLNVLTDEEKEALVADYTRLVEIDNRLCELNDSVWGNTGCESGTCPF